MWNKKNKLNDEQKKIEVKKKKVKEVKDKLDSIAKKDKDKKKIRQGEFNNSYLGEKIGNGIINKVNDKVINDVKYIEVTNDKGVITIL